jgi:hypothetical protein
MSSKIQFVSDQKLLTLGLYWEIYKIFVWNSMSWSSIWIFSINVAGAESLHSEII